MLHSLSPLLLELQYRAHWLLLRPQMVLLADLQASDGFFFFSLTLFVPFDHLG